MTALLMTHTQNSKTGTCVLDLFEGSPLTTQAQLELIRDSWNTNVMPSLGSSTSLTSVTLLGDIPTSVFGSTGGGRGSSTAINTSFLVDKNPDSGRRGRMFIPGVPEEDCDSAGVIPALRVTNMTDGLNAWLADLNAQTMQLRIARSDGSFSLIESFAVQNVAATQRRRLRR